MTQPSTYIIKAADTLQESKAHVLLKDTQWTHPSAEHVPWAVHRQFSGCPRQNTAVSGALLSKTNGSTAQLHHRTVTGQSVYPPAAFVLLPDTRLQFSPTGADGVGNS